MWVPLAVYPKFVPSCRFFVSVIQGIRGESLGNKLLGYSPRITHIFPVTHVLSWLATQTHVTTQNNRNHTFNWFQLYMRSYPCHTHPCEITVHVWAVWHWRYNRNAQNAVSHNNFPLPQSCQLQTLRPMPQEHRSKWLCTAAPGVPKNVQRVTTAWRALKRPKWKTHRNEIAPRKTKSADCHLSLYVLDDIALYIRQSIWAMKNHEI